MSSFNFETDELVNDIDKNIEHSRDIFKHLEEKLCIITEDQWHEIFRKASTRNNEECSICELKLNR